MAEIKNIYLEKIANLKYNSKNANDSLNKDIRIFADQLKKLNCEELGIFVESEFLYPLRADDQFDGKLKNRFLGILKKAELDDESKAIIEASFKRMGEKLKKYANLQRNRRIQFIAPFRELRVLLPKIPTGDNAGFYGVCMDFQDRLVNWIGACKRGILQYYDVEREEFEELEGRLSNIKGEFERCKINDTDDDDDCYYDSELMRKSYKKFSAFLNGDLKTTFEDIEDKTNNPPLGTIEKLTKDLEIGFKRILRF